MTDIVPLRRNVRFQLLWLGSAVSQLGSELTRLAMPLLVLALTGSPGLAGVVAGARTVAFVLVQMPAGVWVDRWDRRRTLVTAQGCQAVVSALLAALILTGRAQAWHFVALAVIDGLCAAFIGPVQDTAIRGIVPPGQLHAAYAQEEARTHAAGLIGPPLGGLLYGLGRAVPFVVDAVTFLAATLCYVLAKVPRRPTDRLDTSPGEDGEGRRPARRGMRREAGEAVAWLWRRKGLREVTAAVMVLNLLGGAFLIPLIVLVGERGGDAFTTGAVLAGLGVGGLVGSLLSGRISRLLPPGRLLPAVVAVFGAALAATALPWGAWWPMVPLVFVTLSTPSLNVVMNVAVARMVPEEMLGRMGAVLSTGGMAFKPLGPVLGGALAAALGGAAALVVLGGLLGLTAAAAVLSPELRGFTGEASRG
ncbi:MFS transporter [Planomonospora parontospora subsp. parontospora]|uniref:MFS transporter n=2 Tax=Planomonospora parontospora TaxID=58119 RepID=A0AA37BH39_9ACTN|nr:MFS transporter [Planomonospora parontospora]GGK70445.1 MFS transporter [Planomonospora parontospora]GII09811.1 MFS transporter [Planomonospora parontospora subsp. parontospora]